MVFVTVLIIALTSCSSGILSNDVDREPVIRIVKEKETATRGTFRVEMSREHHTDVVGMYEELVVPRKASERASTYRHVFVIRSGRQRSEVFTVNRIKNYITVVALVDPTDFLVDTMFDHTDPIMRGDVLVDTDVSYFFD